MREVTLGDTVKAHYKGKFADGRVFDSSEGREPLEMFTGSNQVIPGFENALIGMKEGDSKTISINPEDGYGERSNDLLFDINKAEMPEGLVPQIDMPLEMINKDRGKVVVRICEINDDSIKIDANHQLAGEKLSFDIKLVEIL